MKKSSVIKELVREIRSYKELDYEGWDSYGAAPSDPETRKNAIEFLHVIENVFGKLNLEIPALAVSPGHNGGVGVIYSQEKFGPYLYMRLEPGNPKLSCTIRREKGQEPEVIECAMSEAVTTLVTMATKHSR
jgi:hypothetical protein